MSIHDQALVRLPVPRPQPFEPAVIREACRPVIPAVAGWLKLHAPMLSLDDQAIEFCLIAAFATPHVGADAFRAGLILAQPAVAWPVNMALVRLLDEIASRLPGALKIVVGRWVVEHGLRFPGAAGDMIEYFDEEDQQRAGRVYCALAATGTAVITRAADERNVTICLEQVVANLTQGLYQPITRELGRRFADAPALAASCTEFAGPRPAPTARVGVNPEPPMVA